MPCTTGRPLGNGAIHGFDADRWSLPPEKSFEARDGLFWWYGFEKTVRRNQEVEPVPRLEAQADPDLFRQRDLPLAG